MSSRSDKLTRMVELWRKADDWYAKTEINLPIREIENILSSIFCPGPFYYYVIDFPSFKFSFVHSNIQKILGIKPEDASIEVLSNHVHSKDAGYVLKCEKMAMDFLFNSINPNSINKYKVSYSFRMRDKQGQFSLFLHQAIALSLDDQNRISKVLAVHSNIGHITSENNYKISFIGLDGEQDYLGMDVEEGIVIQEPAYKAIYTKRELEIVSHLADGWNTNEIAEKLFISPETVRTHRNNIRKKLGCKNSAQLVAESIRAGLI